MTSRPASVSSCARIDPVQPSPMITTSLGGSLVVMFSASLRRPLGAPREAHGGMGITLVVPAHPVAVVVAGAGIADHFPAAHILVAAVDRVREESFLRVLQQGLEEELAIGSFEPHFSCFQPTEQLILPLDRQH